MRTAVVAAMSGEVELYTESGHLDRRQLLQDNLALVRRQALRLRARMPPTVELDDLIQAGMVGLLDAAQRFNPAAGTSFGAFASRRVHGAMIDELRHRDWLPRSVRRQGRALEACITKLAQQLGRAPTEQEIAAGMGIDLASYHALLRDTNNGYLLPYEELSEQGQEPAAADAARDTPFEALAQGQRRELLEHAISALPEREKLILALYYQEDLNLKEIGAVLGVSESRVSQLHSQALARLRARLGTAA